MGSHLDGGDVDGHSVRPEDLDSVEADVVGIAPGRVYEELQAGPWHNLRLTIRTEGCEEMERGNPRGARG